MKLGGKKLLALFTLSQVPYEFLGLVFSRGDRIDPVVLEYNRRDILENVRRM